MNKIEFVERKRFSLVEIRNLELPLPSISRVNL